MLQETYHSSKKNLSQPSFTKKKRRKMTLRDFKSLFTVSALYSGLCLLLFFTAKRQLINYGYLFLKGKVNLLSGEEGKVASYCVSSLHGLLIVPSAMLYLTDRISLSTWRKLIGISIGYFFIDTVLFPLYMTNVRDFVQFGIHHLILLFVIVAYFNARPKLIAQGLLSEMTLPFLYACKFLIKIEKTDIMLYKFVAVMTILTWVFSRVISFAHIYYQLYKKGAPYMEYAIFAPVVLMNYYWFFILLQKALC
ncbi:MAG: TLC domain-containing protein [Bacteroidota bacterium]